MKVLIRHLLLVAPVAAALAAAVLIAWTGTAGSIDAGAALLVDTAAAYRTTRVAVGLFAALATVPLAGLRDRAAWAGETMPATLRGAGGLTAVNPLSTLTGHTVRLPPSSPPA